MIKFSIWYIIVAIITNMITSAIVIVKLKIRCNKVNKSFADVYEQYFENGEPVFPVIPEETPPIIAIVLSFILTQVLFPFNVRSLIVNYRNACKDI